MPAEALQEQEAQESFLEMSDEDVLNLPDPLEETSLDTSTPGGLEASNEDAADAGDDEVIEAEAADLEDLAEGEEEGDDPDYEYVEVDTDEDEEEEDSEDADENDSDEEEVDEGEEQDADDEDSDEEESDDTEEENNSEELTAQDFFQKVTSPFKANGKDMTVTKPDDVIQLMQMGANYNKKMAAIKPNLKLLKLLQNNELLDEGKLGFLIDLNKRDPKAITKLLKDSKIDPMALDMEEESDYQPTKYEVADSEVELDTVIAEIKDTESYPKTLEIVSSSWDAKSKQIVADSPQLLRVINDHVASGVYEIISQEVEKEQMFGRLDGLSDIEAYRKIGDKIDSEGGFNHLFESNDANANSEQQPAQRKKVVTARVAKKSDKARKAKKRAAGATKASAATNTDQDFNPLALSDDDFEKQINSQLL